MPGDEFKRVGRPRGTKKTGGRKAGTPNKATRRAREVLVEVIENNAERVQGWLDSIEEAEGAKEALRAYTALIEFAVPRMARNELASEEGPVQLIVSWGRNREGDTAAPEAPEAQA